MEACNPHLLTPFPGAQPLIPFANPNQDSPPYELFSCHFGKRQIRCLGQCLELRRPRRKKRRPAVSQIGGPSSMYVRQRSRTSVSLPLRKQWAPHPGVAASCRIAACSTPSRRKAARPLYRTYASCFDPVHLQSDRNCLRNPQGTPIPWRSQRAATTRAPRRASTRHAMPRPMKSALRASKRKARRQRWPNAPDVPVLTLSPLTARGIRSPVPCAARTAHLIGLFSLKLSGGFQSFPGIPEPLVRPRPPRRPCARDRPSRPLDVIYCCGGLGGVASAWASEISSRFAMSSCARCSHASRFQISR